MSSEHLKYVPDVIDIHLALVVDSMISHIFLPKSLMEVKIIPIVKCATGDISSSSDYRPVPTATSMSKLLEMLLMIYIDNIGCSPFDNQFGFRKGSSTDQCIFMLKERIRRYVDLEGPVYCCFLDASKVFDRVCHSTLFLRLVRNDQRNQTTTANLNETRSKL